MRLVLGQRVNKKVAAAGRVAGAPRISATHWVAACASAPCPSLPAVRCSGITLVELLIVIVILTTLVAAAIPVLSPSTDERRIREASRGVNTFITSAQSKAIAMRRPYGVALKKLSTETGSADDNGVCIELYHVEQPPAFTGFDDASAVQIARDEDRAAPPNQIIIRFVRRGAATARDMDGLLEGWDRDQIPPGVFRRGDTIEVAGNQYGFVDTTRFVDDAGYYIEESGTPNGELVARPLYGTGQLLRFNISSLGQEIGEGGGQISLLALRDDERLGPFWTEPTPYKILRQPTSTSAPPYQLPEGIAIDLRASGAAIDFDSAIPSGFFHRPEIGPDLGTVEEAVSNDSPVVIMFTPEGSIERLHVNNAYKDLASLSDQEDDYFSGPVVSNIYLLIARRENIPAPAPDPTIDLSLDPNTMAQDTMLLPDAEREKLTSPINWLNLDSRWVVIGAQSGRVVTTENAFVDLQAWSIDTSHAYVNVPSGVSAPLWRRAVQIFGAREFAREMTQLGGR